MTVRKAPQVVAVGRGVEGGGRQAPVRGARHEALNIWIGRWINEGATAPVDGAPSQRITTSDVYEWMPGGFFILHTAYGRIGDVGVGGTEIIGYDVEAGAYRSYFFDSFGNITAHTLTARDNVWTFQGETTRATVVFEGGGRTQSVRHERTDDGQAYVLSMEVTLRKIE